MQSTSLFRRPRSRFSRTRRNSARKPAKRLRSIEPLEDRMLLSLTADWVIGVQGPDSDQAFDTAVAPDGNVYVTGRFDGTTDFDPGLGTAELTAVGEWDIFVAKYDSDGNFVWAKRMGGTDVSSVEGVEEGAGITIDSAGDVYVTGTLKSSDADFGSFNLAAAETDVFVAKLDSAGTVLWANNFSRTVDCGQGGSPGSGPCSGDLGFDVAIDDSPVDPADWSVYSVGESFSMPVILKFDAQTGQFVWSQFVDQTSELRRFSASAVDVDNAGNVLVTGSLDGTAVFGGTTLKAAKQGKVQGYDVFVTTLDPAGNFIWASRMGGGGDEIGYDIAWDSSGIYLTGEFGDAPVCVGPACPDGTFPADFGSFTLTSSGKSDAFVSKLDLNGNVLWATRMGGELEDQGGDVVVTAAGEVIVSGRLTSSSADFGSQVFNSANGEAFFSRLDLNGNFVDTIQYDGLIVFSSRWGGLAVSPTDDVYVTGGFWGGSTFPTGDTLVGPGGFFLLKFANEQFTHDVAVTGVPAPGSAVVSDVVSISVDVANQGTSAETFDVSLASDNGTPGDGSDDFAIATWTSMNLGSGGSTTLNTNWDTAGASLATHTLTATGHR